MSDTLEPMTDDAPMGMMLFFATEGGRKCPLCGRYARPGELGNLSHTFYNAEGEWVGHVSRYGHLPGTGCNRERDKA